MAIKKALVSLENIDDKAGLETVVIALQNIDGVIGVEIQPDNQVATVSFDDTETSIHAFTAAINTVDYVTQPFPDDAPQNPDN